MFIMKYKPMRHIRKVAVESRVLRELLAGSMVDAVRLINIILLSGGCVMKKMQERV